MKGVAIFVLLFFLGLSNDLLGQSVSSKQDKTEKIIIPDDLKRLINTKCLSCHMPKSVNKSARKKLQWENVDEYGLKQQRHFIDKMLKVIKKNKMPPKKTLKQFPELELSVLEKEKFLKWLQEEEKRIGKN